MNPIRFPASNSFTGPQLSNEITMKPAGGAAGTPRLASVLLLSLLVLAGCKSGESTEALPNTGSSGSNNNYSGPPPATEDVQSFKVNVWDNLVSEARCGACHGTGGQSPTFVQRDDINLAYSRANTIVRLNDPSESLMVTKVAGGHNCWLSSDTACADTITSYIENWASGAIGSVKTVELRSPQLKDPGATLAFPADSSAFGATIYPLLTDYCSDCHVEGLQAPFLASANQDVAYDESQSRINLQNPGSSRLVERLIEDSHNCWADDCVGSATAMQMAIEDLVASLSLQEIDPDMVASKALNLLADGLLANAGGRFEDNIIALYEFKTGEGFTAFDTSGVEPALHLNLVGNVEWVGGWGINIGPAYEDEATGTLVRNGKAQGSTTASRKLHDLLTGTGEYSIETWVAPGNIAQEEVPIITYSGSSDSRNLTLRQSGQNYEVLHRSSTTDQNAVFATADGDQRLQATLQHVVVTFSAGEGRKIYINGEHTGDVDQSTAGLFNEWDDSFALVMGNEAGGNALWQGTLRMAAIHSRALTAAQVATNYEAGVGQKYFMLFSVSHLIDMPQSFIVFEVSQFDSYSYLFSEPFFISLDPTQEPEGIPVAGIRIGINGKLASVGQAYANLELTLSSNDYTPGTGQPLSSRGTIIGLDNGPEVDEFFLSFDLLGDNQNVFVDYVPPASDPAVDGDPMPHIGLKTFDEINASMARMTGVSATHPAVKQTFALVRQQLPSIENINGFLSSQQMAVTQLAIQYCDALVEDSSLRASFFPGFNFGASAGTAFDTTAEKDQVINPLLASMVGSALASQPDDASLRTELGALMDRLTACGGTCAGDRTETVVKASCAAVLGSAVTLVQ